MCSMCRFVTYVYMCHVGVLHPLTHHLLSIKAGSTLSCGKGLMFKREQMGFVLWNHPFVFSLSYTINILSP